MAQRRVVQDDGQQTYIIIGGVVVIAVFLIGILLYLNLREPPGISGVVNFPRPARGHDENLQLPFSPLPPAGGTHNPTWQNCGIYTQPVRTENALHSMEHGAVWISYQTTLAQSEVTKLQDLVRGESFLILAPYAELKSPIVLTAWGVQLEVDSASDKRIAQFIEQYRLGPQTPEKGATCDGGTGNPTR